MTVSPARSSERAETALMSSQFLCQHLNVKSIRSIAGTRAAGTACGRRARAPLASSGKADCAPTLRAAARSRAHSSMLDESSRGIRMPPFSATKSSRIIARVCLA